MSEKNRDFVAYMPSLDCSWTFTREVRAETVAETYDEMLELCRDVFCAGDRFLIPTGVRFTLHAFEEDTDANRIFQVHPTEIESGEIDDEDGVEFDQLERRINEEVRQFGSTVSIFEVEIASAATNLALDDREIAVDRETEDAYKWMYHGEPTDRRPSFDPITVGIHRRKETESGEPVYKIIVNTDTDIWFEETEIGRQNLRRLVAFLSELDDRLDPNDVDFHSERYLAFDSPVMPEKFLSDEFHRT